MYDLQKVVDVATVTKLTRNLFIIAVIPIVSYLFYKNSNELSGNQVVPKWYKLVPLFVLGFLFLSFVRTIGDVTLASSGSAFGFVNEKTWEEFYHFWSSFGSQYMLGTAMAGVGLSTDFRTLKGLGLNPFYLGIIAAFIVGIVSFSFISLFRLFI